jgi:hypothetical protein
MRHSVLNAAVGLFGIVVGVMPARSEAAQITSTESIVVRTYTTSGSGATLRAARRTTATILADAGIDVSWVVCAMPGEAKTGTDACAGPLRWNEVVVRITAAAPPAAGTSLATLGFAAVDCGAARGSLATIYADRVARMAETAGIDPAELLGRAIAHEIGHLLLGTNRHASRGLMRAYWSAEELRRAAASQWLFAGKERSQLREGVINRRPSES